MSPVSLQTDSLAGEMKEENLFRRRFSLGPTATTPPKIDPRALGRNLSYGGDNDVDPISPGTSATNVLSVLGLHL